ncbi:MAG: phosphate acyltransferase PlsX [Planctomycetota bacterium]|nr:phosphate acyltransferase PlsX [Planctomycetota bacterium]
MRIAIDVMGTDLGPSTVIRGAISAARQYPEVRHVLVGDEAVIRGELARFCPGGAANVEIEHASQVVSMSDKLSGFREKRDSSVARAVKLVASGHCDGLVTLGNTAAAVAFSTLMMKCLEGIQRPGIAVPFPSLKGVCLGIDMGANVNPKPEHLRDYGVMGSVYMQAVMGVPSPRVGLINVGSEETKGTPEAREAFALLKEADINFIGNVEGGDIFYGRCEVAVCDGYAGNVMLKAAEGLAESLMTAIREELRRTIVRRIGAAICRPAFRALAKRTDYAEWGGAPLLGVNGICIIGHGRSNSRAVANAIRAAREAVSQRLCDRIVSMLK